MLMQIELDAQLVEQLEAIARRQGRNVNDVVREMIAQYRSPEDRAAFKSKIRRVINKHADLLDKLAKS
jgi:hypothetical protein